jgi:hypothetical protein
MEPEVASPSADASRVRGIHIAAWLMVAGGVLALTTPLLGWARVSYPTPAPSFVVESVGHVRAGALLGAFMLIAGGVAIIAHSPDVRRAWLITGIACGLALGGIAVFDLLTEKNRVVDALVRSSTQPGQPPPPPGLIAYSVRPGLFVALLAAALALAAGVVLLTTRSLSRPTADPEAPEAPPS